MFVVEIAIGMGSGQVPLLAVEHCSEEPSNNMHPNFAHLTK